MTLTPKVPGETKDYGIEWEDALAAGDAISASTWSVPVGLTKVDEEYAGTVTLVRIAGGTVGTSYTLTNTITTVNGETLIGEIVVQVMSGIEAAGL